MGKNNLIEIKKNAVGRGLLIETDGFMSLHDTDNNRQLKESVSSGEWNCPQPFIVDAVFQKYDIKNANGRIYPEKVLREQVEKYRKKIAAHNAYGELNHPAESTIDLGRISHNIIDLQWRGHTLVGKIELHISPGFKKYGIVSTMGDMAANELLSGYKIGVSSRGVGSVEERMGNYIVGDDFELICWDIVSDPSTPGAYIGKEEELSQYVESKEVTLGKNPLNEKISRIKDILNS